MTSRIKCPKCGHRLPKDWNPNIQGTVCGNCGKEIRGTHALHKLIASNSKEIAHDYVTIGLTQTIAKWGISYTAIYRLPEVQAMRGRYSKIIANKGSVPSLPAFKESWPDEVKARWFEVYKIVNLPAFNEKWTAETKTQWLKTFDNILANVSDDFELKDIVGVVKD